MKATDAIIDNGVRKTQFRITALDGMSLAATLQEPQQLKEPVSGIVIVNSGTGIRRQYYEAYAVFLAINNFRVITFDYRGIGDSRPASLRGFHATARQWGELDIASVIKWAAERYPDEKLCVVGHSMGGQLLGLASNIERIDRVLFVAAQSGYWRLFRSPYKYGWALLWYLGLPVLVSVFGYFPARILGLGADLPAGVAREFGAWCRDPCYMIGTAHGISREGFARLHAPILAYSIEDDDAFAPQEAVDSLLKLYVNARIERYHVQPQELELRKIGHFGFFRPAAAKSLWPPTLKWFTQA